jgi:hypothetical protein
MTMTASKTHDSDFFKAFLLQRAKYFGAFRCILTGMAWVGFEAPQIPVHGASPKQKTPADEDRGLKMVAWGRIELPTRGFSKHVAAKTSMFMGIAA